MSRWGTNIDGIVLTQACDIANKKVENIILCAITSKSEFEEIINNYKSEEFSQDYYIINFKDIFSVPVNVARAITEKNGKNSRSFKGFHLSVEQVMEEIRFSDSHPLTPAGISGMKPSDSRQGNPLNSRKELAIL